MDHKPLTLCMAKASELWSARQQHQLSYISEFTTDTRQGQHCCRHIATSRRDHNLGCPPLYWLPVYGQRPTAGCGHARPSAQQHHLTVAKGPIWTTGSQPDLRHVYRSVKTSGTKAVATWNFLNCAQPLPPISIHHQEDDHKIIRMERTEVKKVFNNLNKITMKELQRYETVRDRIYWVHC